MSSHRYKPERGEFDKRLVSIAERIKRGAEEDSGFLLLRSIWRISRFAADPRSVYCDAVRRVINQYTREDFNFDWEQSRR